MFSQLDYYDMPANKTAKVVEKNNVPLSLKI